MSKDDQLEIALNAYDESLHDLIEDLLWEYFGAEDQDAAVQALAVRRRRLREEREMLKERKEQIEENIKEIDNELQIITQVADDIPDDKIEYALEKCKTIEGDKRDPSNPAIENQADKVGLTPQLFIEKLNEKYPVDKFGNPIDDNK
jgi:hypothetical protein